MLLFLLVVFALPMSACDAAFLPAAKTVSQPTRLMIGGRGWQNDDYLGGLSGDDEDLEKAKEDYQDYSERRSAFMKRQEEIMKTPQGKSFMEQQQQRNAMMAMNDFEEDSSDDEFSIIEPTSGGGSRMAEMMSRVKRVQKGRPGLPGGMMPPGFEQKLFNLDDEEEED